MSDKKFLKKLEKLVEEETPNPKTEPTPDPAELPPVLSEHRKRALVTYLALLFGAAFLIVAISLVVTWKTHVDTVEELNSSASNAMSRAEALQQENQVLSKRVEDLEQALEYSEAGALEYVEAMQAEANLSVQRTSQAYELLILAQEALRLENEENFTEIMLRLEPLAPFLGEQGRITYDTLLAFDWSTVQTD